MGQDMIKKGAIAFFGYSAVIGIDDTRIQEYCDCDIKIDRALIIGKTCDEAYKEALAEYNSLLEYYKRKGWYYTAGQLERNRDLLVSPSTDAKYGDKNARLNTGWSVRT